MSTQYYRVTWIVSCTILYSAGAALLNSIGCAPQRARWTPSSDEYLHLGLYKCEQIDFRLLRDDVELYCVTDGTFDSLEVAGRDRVWPRASVIAVHREGGEQSHRIHEYRSFAYCVDLKSPGDAAELFRFFSTRQVWPLTAIEEYEVYPDPNAPVKEVCGLYASKIPPDVWKAAGLAEPRVVEKGDYYEVTRFVIRECPLTDKRRLYICVDRIGRKGEGYKRLSEEEVIPTPVLVNEVRSFVIF